MRLGRCTWWFVIVVVGAETGPRLFGAIPYQHHYKIFGSASALYSTNLIGSGEFNANVFVLRIKEGIDRTEGKNRFRLYKYSIQSKLK